MARIFLYFVFEDLLLDYLNFSDGVLCKFQFSGYSKFTKKGIQHRRFHVSLVKFLDHLFRRNFVSDCLCYFQI